MNQEQNEEQEKDPNEIASQLLYYYTPLYQNLVKQLTTNEMRRMLLKLVEYPLNDKAYKGNREIEDQTFAIGQRLLESKFILVMNTYADNVEEMKKLAEENKKEQETNG